MTGCAVCDWGKYPNCATCAPPELEAPEKDWSDEQRAVGYGRNDGPYGVSDEGKFYETGDDEDERIDAMARTLGYA